MCDDFGFDCCIVDSSFKYCFESNIFFLISFPAIELQQDSEMSCSVSPLKLG